MYTDSLTVVKRESVPVNSAKSLTRLRHAVPQLVSCQQCVQPLHFSQLALRLL